MAASAIDVEDLRFRWVRDGPAVIDIESFRVEAGERVLLHGPSGCGKSTFLGLLTGVLAPDQGTVRLLGRDFSRLRSSARDRIRAVHIGYIFQQFNLLPYLSAEANVLLPARLSSERGSRTASRGRTLDVARGLLERMGLHAETWARPAGTLSVGQQQRVAAARALIGAPEILIGDEPTSALDEDNQREFLELLFEQAAAANSALVIVSHDPRIAPFFDRRLPLAEINRAVFA